MKMICIGRMTPLQHAVLILIGTILGDSHIQKTSATTNKCRVRVCHSINQSAYVLWKHKVFLNYCKTTKPPYFTNRKECLFYTSYDRIFTTYHDQWYIKEKHGFQKKISDSIYSILVDPKSLAIWYLDDGTKRKGSNGCRIATQSFSLEENEKLQACFEKNFGLIVKIDRWYSKGKVRYSLSLPSRTYILFKELLYSFVQKEIPTMLYKFE